LLPVQNFGVVSPMMVVSNLFYHKQRLFQYKADHFEFSAEPEPSVSKIVEMYYLPGNNIYFMDKKFKVSTFSMPWLCFSAKLACLIRVLNGGGCCFHC
jgi:hypothetical protein